MSPADALRMTRCLRELVIGHALSVAMTQAGRSRKPEPGSPGYNLLAEAADATILDDHCGPGLTALLNGFTT
ncbi:hypothetical protein ABZW11_24280 [Nonomuraea sp. NPDC004580]|uniref:hypothetical protein n=1 Tax=Nonomuraea sp. NPDC004580 TaxID=3154552 RepID=UPI0033BE6432